MTPENILREKLRKIEALFAGVATAGKKAAAARMFRFETADLSIYNGRRRSSDCNPVDMLSPAGA